MTVTVPLTSEEEAALQARAKAQGLSVDSLLRQAVLQIISAPKLKSEELSAAQWEKEFEDLFNSLPDSAGVSEEAFNRSSWYR